MAGQGPFGSRETGAKAMGFILFAGVTFPVAFLVALVIGRAYRTIALLVATLPLAVFAGFNLSGLGDALVLVSLVLIWAAGVAGGFAGVWLARKVRDRRRP